MKTSIKFLFFLPVLLTDLGLFFTSQATAQTFTTLHSFNGNDGNNPQAGLIAAGNTLYGVTEYSSLNHGAVFAVNTNGGGFMNLYGFSGGNDGRNPDGTLLLSGNTLYGTVYYGGIADVIYADVSGIGTVYKVNTNGSGFLTLYSFKAGKTNPSSGLYTNSDGACPEVGLILSGNTLYGTTEHGGTSGYGTVFKINTDGSGFVNLHNFTNGSDGSDPHCLVISGNTLYGTTFGLSGNGTVFALNTNGTGFTTLHSFTAINFTLPKGGPGPAPGYTNTDGVMPTGLTLSGNTLYGTAYAGGTNGNGTVFSLNTNGTGFMVLHSFAASSTNSSGVYVNSEGTHPIMFTGLILSSNTLYGTANYGGGAGNGTIFALNTNGTSFTTIYKFTATDSVTGTNNDGANPYAGLVLSGNTLYGTATSGGNSGAGTVFSISLALLVNTTSLPNGTNGVVYSQTLTASGGQIPYTWTNISGTLPLGLTLANNGIITGTPTNDGTFTFSVKVTDALSIAATQILALTVVGPPIVTIQPTNNPLLVTVGNNVVLAVSVAGTGPFSYQWQLSGTNLPSGIISTVAGNGNYGYSGDGGAAISAELFYAESVSADAIGNLYIADSLNNRIRKVGTNGIITTMAGNGTNGYSGDGGAATNASLSDPSGLALDASGNLFIADSGNQLIRKVDTNGIMSTVLGIPCAGLTLDRLGNLFMANGSQILKLGAGTNGTITTVAGNGTYGSFGDGIAATNASLDAPSGVTLDAFGNLFIADSGNNIIRKVGANGIISTIAGDGLYSYLGDGGRAIYAALFNPTGVVLDNSGNLFIADTGNNRIRKVDTNGIITLVAGNGSSFSSNGDGGMATNATILEPSGVALDAYGNLFISELYRIRKVVIIQGPKLVLNGVGFGNTGAYDVVVSNPYGSVTSSVVNLTIALPPVILSGPQIFVGKTNFTFLLSGPAGSNYVLQATTNLLNWSPVITSAIPVSGSVNLTNAITNFNRRFYRVHLQ